MKTLQLWFSILLLLNMSMICINANSADINFDMKKFKEVEVNFEESESNNLNTPWKDREVNFAYRNEPVSEIVTKIMMNTGKKVIGMEQLADNKPGVVLMTKTKSLKAVTILLKCAGFKMIETEKYFQVVEDRNINRNACLY